MLALAFGIGSLLACGAPIAENTAPRIDVTAPLDGGVFALGTPVTYTVDVADRDGDAPLTVTINSSIDGELASLEALSAAEILSGTITTLSAGRHDLTFVVDDGQPEGQRSVLIGVFVNSPPSAATVAITPADPSHTEDLTAEITSSSVDPEGSAIGYAWTWLKDGAESGSGGGEIALLAGSSTEPGEVWTIRFEAYEAANGVRAPGGLSTFTTASVTIGNEAPPAPTSVEVLPSSPHPAQDARCLVQLEIDPDGDPVTATYAWSINGSTVAGQTSERLPASLLFGGEALTCTAAATDGAATSAPVSASATVRDAVSSFEDADSLLDDDGSGTLAPVVSPLFLDALPGVDGLIVSAPGDGSSRWYRPTTWSAAPSGALPTPDLTLSVAGLTSVRSIPDYDGDRIDDLLVVSPSSSTFWVVRSAGIAFGGSEPSLAILGAAATATAVRNLGAWGDPVVGNNLETTGRRSEVVARVDRTEEPDRVLAYADDGLTFGITSTGSGFASLSGCITADYTDEAFGVDLDVSGDVTGDGAADLAITRSFPLDRVDNAADPDDLDVGAYIIAAIRMAAPSVDCEDTASASAWMRLVVAPGIGGATGAGFFPDLDGDAKADPWAASPRTSKGTVAWFSSQVGAAGFVKRDASAGDALFTIEGEAAGDGAGFDVVVLGDLGSDGLPEVAILASNTSGVRAVYVFEGATLAAAAATSVPGSRPTLSVTEADWTVVASGDHPLLVGPAIDVDGDGALDLLLGGGPDDDAATAEVFGTWFSGR